MPDPTQDAYWADVSRMLGTQGSNLNDQQIHAIIDRLRAPIRWSVDVADLILAGDPDGARELFLITGGEHARIWPPEGGAA